MEKVILFSSLAFLASPALNAAPIFTNANIDLVFAGYSDSSIAFIPVEGTLNPAGCPQTQAYVMPGIYETKGALSIFLNSSHKRITH